MRQARDMWIVKQGDYHVYTKKPKRSFYLDMTWSKKRGAYYNKKKYFWRGTTTFHLCPQVLRSIYPELREVDLKRDKLYRFKANLHISEVV